MRVQLVSYSPDIETLIAVSMLTTTSGAMPSTLFDRLKNKPEKVADIVSRIEVQHGNILEHNRLIWKLEASRDEILDVILKTKFLSFSESNNQWIVSGNLRSVIELHLSERNKFTNDLVDTLRIVSPSIYDFIMRSEQ